MDKKYFKKVLRVKKENRILLIFLLVLFVSLFGVLVLSHLISDGSENLTLGDSAIDFCSEICSPKDYFSSNNNTEFNFIRCECSGEVKLSHNFEGTKYPEREVSYYDSVSFEEVSGDEVLSRIKS